MAQSGDSSTSFSFGTVWFAPRCTKPTSRQLAGSQRLCFGGTSPWIVRSTDAPAPGGVGGVGGVGGMQADSTASIAIAAIAANSLRDCVFMRHPSEHPACA
jgi:hypothetical protein